MRENRTPGSGRGASGNRRPYRDGLGYSWLWLFLLERMVLSLMLPELLSVSFQ